MGRAPHNQLISLGADFYCWLIQMLHRRGKYERLGSPNSRRRRVRVLKLGTRSSWRLKRVPKIQIRWASPTVFLARLRDAYVKWMLAASSRLTSPGVAMGSFALNGGRKKPFGELQLKEYENKILVEMYKSLPQNQLILIRRAT